jgi:hypothetical protein
MMTLLFSRKIFFVLRSLWIIPLEWRYPMPCEICVAIFVVLFKLNLSLRKWMWACKVNPLHSDVTSASFGGFMQAPMNKIRFSCRVFLNVPT